MTKLAKITVFSTLIVLCLCGLTLRQAQDTAFAGALPDTGQTRCYNDTAEITCPAPGEDFYGQDAQYTTNPRSYTKLDAGGNDPCRAYCCPEYSFYPIVIYLSPCFKGSG